MQLYVLDRSLNTLATTADFYNDTHVKDLTVGASTYEFTVDKTDDFAKYLDTGNLIVFVDDQGRPWSFSIFDSEETQTTKTVYAEDAGIELINKAIDVWSFTEAHPFSYYFDLVTDGTPWELGVNQLDGLERTLTYTGQDTGLGRLMSVLTAFDNAEAKFDIKMQGTVPVKYVVNVYKQIGTVQDNIQIVYGEELNDITKKESRKEFVTALAGIGGTIQDTSTDTDTTTTETKPEEHVDFADLEYNDGEYFTEKGDKFLRARNANQQFNPGDRGYVEAFYSYDTQSSQELFNRTLTQLQTRSKPQFTYEADVKVIDPHLDIGDTVKLIDQDYNPDLYLQARVSKLEKSYSDPTKGSITFANYVVINPDIEAQLKALQDRVNGIKNGDTYYLWIRYADDDQGTGMSASPKDKLYMAVVPAKNNPVSSDNVDDYVGSWVLIAGANGLPGKDGEDGNSSYVHIAYANSVDGKTDFTTNQEQALNRDYMGTYADFSAAQSTDPIKYVWQLTRGRQGPQGLAGSKDVPVVTVGTVKPATPKDGDMWYQQTKDTDGTRITGFFVYTGGAWQPSSIDQSVLVLTKLVSVEIDSAQINSPDITVPFDYYDAALTEYKGTMEFSGGQITHISTLTGGTMLKTVLSPDGYTLRSFNSSNDYKNDKSDITVQLSPRDLSFTGLGNGRTSSYGDDGWGGSTLNSGGTLDRGLDIKYADMIKYVSEDDGVVAGSGRNYNWFNIMNGIMSHPNLIRNSTFRANQDYWNNFDGRGYLTNNDHDGNYAIRIVSDGTSKFIEQDIAHVPDWGRKLSLSYWAYVDNWDGGVNAGVLLTQPGWGTITCTINDALNGEIGKWKLYVFENIEFRQNANALQFSFFNNEHNGNTVRFSQPMLTIDSKIWPYQPT